MNPYDIFLQRMQGMPQRPPMMAGVGALPQQPPAMMGAGPAPMPQQPRGIPGQGMPQAPPMQVGMGGIPQQPPAVHPGMVGMMQMRRPY